MILQDNLNKNYIKYLKNNSKYVLLHPQKFPKTLVVFTQNLVFVSSILATVFWSAKKTRKYANNL